MRPGIRTYLLILVLASAVGCREKALDATAYKNRGASYAQKGDYDRAIQDYDQAITLKPDFANAFNDRGMAYQAKGAYDRAVKDFDQAIKLKPDNSTALKNRGRTQFYLGRFAEAASDLQQGAHYDSTNAYVVLWLHLARRHLGQDDTGDFLTRLAKTDTIQWPAPVARYYLGKSSEDQLIAAASKTDPRVHQDQRCAAAFYIGEYALVQHQVAEAKRRLEEARAGCPHTWSEYLASAAELQRLGSP